MYTKVRQVSVLLFDALNKKMKKETFIQHNIIFECPTKVSIHTNIALISCVLW